MTGALSRFASGTFAGLVALGAQLVVQLVSVPILLRHWSSETYGIWLATSSLFGLLITLDMGHQGYVGAQLLQRVGVDDDAARRTLQAGLAGALGLAIAESTLAAALFATGILDEAVAAPRERTAEVAATFALLVVPWLLFGSAGGVLVRLYTPLGLYARATWIGLLHRTTGVLAGPIAAALGGGLVHAALAIAVINAFWSAVIVIDLARFERYRPFLTWRIDRAELTGNLGGSLLLTVAAFVAQLQQHGLLVILGTTAVGASSIAIFGTTRTIANLFVQAASTFVSPLAPDLVRAHVTGDSSRAATLVVGLGGIGLVVSTFGFAVVTPVVEPAYEAWTGRALRFDMGVFALLAATVVVRTAASPMLTLLQGTNALGPQLLLAGVQTAVTLGLAAVTSRVDAIRGACAAILCGELAASWLVLPFLAARHAPLLRREVSASRAARLAIPAVLVVAVLVTAAYGAATPRVTCAGLLVISVFSGAVVYFTIPPDVRARLRERLRRRPS